MESNIVNMSIHLLQEGNLNWKIYKKIRHLVDLLLQLPRQPSLFNFSFISTNYTSYCSKKLINTILANFFL